MTYGSTLDEEKKFFERKEENEIGPLSRALLRTKSDGKYGVYNDYAGDDIYAINNNKTIIHKYKDRLLILVTDKCVMQCAYCFRQVNLGEFVHQDFEALVDDVISYLHKHPEIEEVIFSGGDPITLGAENLEYFYERIVSEAEVKHFRLHTRSIVYAPEMLSEEILSCLKKYDVRLIFHIIHPYEVYDEVEKKIKEIIDCGIRCYNQFPILRNVNDDVCVLKRLLETLDKNHVRNLTMFIPDPLNMLEEYRVSIGRVATMFEEMETTMSSWINSTRCMFDSVDGKISIKNLIKIEANIAYFRKGEKIVEFPDIPAEIDIPGKVENMLWKG